MRHRIVQDIVDAYERADDRHRRRRPVGERASASEVREPAARRPATGGVAPQRRRRHPARRRSRSARGPRARSQVFGADEQDAAPVDVDRWVDARPRGAGGRGGAAARPSCRSCSSTRRPSPSSTGGSWTPTAPPTCSPSPSTTRWSPGAGPTAGTAGPDRDEPEPGDLPCCSATSWCARRSRSARRPAHAGSYDDELALLVVHGVLHVLGTTTPSPRRPRSCRPASASCSTGSTIGGDGVAPAALALTVPTDAVAGSWRIVVLLAARGRSSPRPRRRSPASPGRGPRPWPRRGAATATCSPTLVRRPEQSVTTVVFLRVACQLVQATLVGVLANGCSAPVGVAVAIAVDVVVVFVLAEAAPKTWAVLDPERVALAVARPVRALAPSPPLRLGRPGADRPDQRGAARQGAQAGPVRLVRRGAAGRRRARRRGGRHRGGGARAHRVDHRVRRHDRARGDGPPARHGHGLRPLPGGRRDGGVPAQRLQPPAGVRRRPRRRGRAGLRQGPDGRRARRQAGRAGARAGAPGPLRPRDQAGARHAAGDAARQVPHGDRGRRVRRHRRAGHARGPHRGAGGRDRRRVRHRRPHRRAAARRRHPRSRPHARSTR